MAHIYFGRHSEDVKLYFYSETTKTTKYHLLKSVKGYYDFILIWYLFDMQYFDYGCEQLRVGCR